MTDAYIARDPHGCVVACTVDDPDRKRETARETAKWIRDGLSLERHTVEDVRLMTFGCAEKRAARKAAAERPQAPKPTQAALL